MRTRPGLMFALLLCPAALLAEVHHTVPEQYLGRWGATLQACTDPTRDPLALSVEPLVLRFPADAARVQAAVSDGPLRVSLLLDSSDPAASRDPGEFRREFLQFELSSDQKTLRTVSEGRTIASRVRCPLNTAA